MQIAITVTPNEIAALVAALQEPHRRTTMSNESVSLSNKNVLDVDKLTDSILGVITGSATRQNQKPIHGNTST